MESVNDEKSAVLIIVVLLLFLSGVLCIGFSCTKNWGIWGMKKGKEEYTKKRITNLSIITRGNGKKILSSGNLKI